MKNPTIRNFRIVQIRESFDKENHFAHASEMVVIESVEERAFEKALPPLDYFEHLCKYLHKCIDK